MTLLLTSLLTTLALAQDADDDGCIDSHADANGACVDVTATLDPSATVGASATVQAYADVGPDVELGTSTHVGARASITGRVDAVGPLPIGAGTVIGRRALIGADQDIGSDNTFSRAVTTGARLQTGEGVTVGYASTVGDDVVLGGYSTIGSLTGIGDYTHVAPLTVIARSATIADSLSLANIAGTIGPNVTIGWGADLDPGTRIRKDAELGNNVTTLGDVRIGRDANIGDNVVLGDRVRIRAGGNVLDWAQVPEDTVIGRNETVGPINTPPTAGTWAVEPLGPVEGVDDLVCTAQVAPADADVWQVLDVSIDWQRDGVDWDGATGTGTYAGDTIPGAQTVEADAWRCRASVSDGTETVDSAWSAAVTVEPSIAGGTEVITLPGGASMTFRGIPAGTFEMGCKPGRDDDASGVSTGLANCGSADLHSVTLTHEFWCAETEVTQAQFAAAPGSPTPSRFSPTGTSQWAAISPNQPVETVRWHEAAWYANWLTTVYNSANGISLSQCYSCSGSYDPYDSSALDCSPVANVYTCDGFRLPTGAEWEYAARGGESHPFAGSRDVDTVAWHAGNRGAFLTPTWGTKPAATLAANAFGLYDMSGNVREWANDWSNGAPDSTAAATDPLGPASGSHRVARGGSFNYSAESAAIVWNSATPPNRRYDNLGFRLCRSVP